MAEKNSVRCIIISGCPCADIDLIREYVNRDDFLICADRGYNYAEQINIVPDVIVGDFDSFSGALPDTRIVSLNTHKDDTDTAHCAKIAIELGFKKVIILGALGGRNDHGFANYCVLQYLNENGVEGIIIDRNETVEFKTQGTYSYDNLKDRTFSVFPFACNEAVVSYHGECEYNADNLVLKSSLAMGISNVFRSNEVKIQIHSGKVLIFTENI